MKTNLPICFEAQILQPQPSGGSKGKVPNWCFLILPKAASAKLSSRGRASVRGAMNGFAFRATLEPDGAGSHWLKIGPKLRAGASAQIGDIVTLEIAPTLVEPQPRVPADFRRALAASTAAQATWTRVTAIARKDWIHWITSAKQLETRQRRIVNACQMLASGKRRVCCFDRSGIYSKSLSSPKAVG